MIIEYIFWDALFAFLFGLLFEFIPISPLYGKARQMIALLLQAKQTGLKAVYARSDSIARKWLEETFKKAESPDEILIVGRTHYGFLRDSKQLIMGVIKRGIVLKMLILDREAIAKLGPEPPLDLRSLGLKNAHWLLARDLRDAETYLKQLRDSCKALQYKGSLEVYRTKVLVQSSVIISVPGKEAATMRVTYDFSFGDELSDKFIQRYEFPRSDSSADFCNRLYRFYKGMFDQSVCSLAYDLSYRPSQEKEHQKEVEQVAGERIRMFIDGHREFEAVRDNALNRIIPAAAAVFKSLYSAEPAPPPFSIQIELTNRCSTSCNHCFRYMNRGPYIAEMITDNVIQLLTDLKVFGVRTITFSGGEPTQHPKFIQILHHAAQQGLAVGVLSNGVGLSNEVLDGICQYARWLRLSIDGSTADVYRKVRRSMVSGEDAFAQIESTVKHFVTKNVLAPQCRLAICYTIQKFNAEDIPNMISWVQKLGVPGGDRCLTFKFAHGSNGFLCTEGQIKNLYENVFIRPEFLGLANLDYLRWFLEHQSSLPDLIAGRPTEGLYLRQPTRCFTPYLFALIDPSGNVFPCCFLYEDNKDYSDSVENKRKGHRIGNVFSGRFEDIWRSREYERVRRDLEFITPTIDRYWACGECTRHCNHNMGLSMLYDEYKGSCDAGGDGDVVMSRIVGRGNTEGVWL